MRKNPRGERLFLFNVTIQNHGGYNTSDFESDVHYEGNRQYANADQYLSLIKKSDEYLKQLIDYFKEQDEPVVLVFFGDHQPTLDEEFYKEVQAGENDREKETAKHLVPYVIWSNKGLEPENRGITSACYLGSALLEAAGIPSSDYYDFVSEVSDEIPALNCYEYLNKNGEYKDTDSSFKGIVKNSRLAPASLGARFGFA